MDRDRDQIRLLICFLILLCGLVVLACNNKNERLTESPITSKEAKAIIEDKSKFSLDVTSNVLLDSEQVSPRYTCVGDDVSPHIQWSNAPKDTKGFALIFERPSAVFYSYGRPFVHWVVYGIPPGVNELEQALPRTDTLPNGAKQGLNDFENLGYEGPCPPAAGIVYDWVFTVYALDIDVDLSSGATAVELMSVISDHILVEGSLKRKYRSPTDNEQTDNEEIKKKQQESNRKKEDVMVIEQ